MCQMMMIFIMVKYIRCIRYLYVCVCVCVCVFVCVCRGRWGVRSGGGRSSGVRAGTGVEEDAPIGLHGATACMMRRTSLNEFAHDFSSLLIALDLPRGFGLHVGA